MVSKDGFTFTYHTPNGFVMDFVVDGPGIYMQCVSDLMLQIDVYDISHMLQTSVTIPDYSAFVMLQTLDALKALEDNDAGMATKTIEVPIDNGVRKSIILSTDYPNGRGPDGRITMGILDTNIFTGDHDIKTYLLDPNDEEFPILLNFLYGYFEMDKPRNNVYGYPVSYYYWHLDEFFDY